MAFRTYDNDSTQTEFSIFTDNITVSGMEQSKKNLLGYLEAVLAVLLLTCNLFVVVVILSSKQLRHSSKYLLILNLSFIDLIKIVALAVNVYMKFAKSLDYECDLQYIFRLVTDLTTGLSGIFIVLLNIDYIATTNTSSFYPGRRLIGPVILAFLSYIITGAVLVPLFVLHLQPEYNTESSTYPRCWSFYTYASFLAYEALTVVPQSILILVSGGMIIGACISRSYLLNISKELNLVRRPIDLNLAGFFTFTMNLVPYFYDAIRKLVCVCIHCSVMKGLDIVIPLLPFIKCVILPFLWLFCPDFRTALNLCCTKRPTRVAIKSDTVVEDPKKTEDGGTEEIMM